MKIIVTGCSGFIGSDFCRKYEKYDDVEILGIDIVDSDYYMTGFIKHDLTKGFPKKALSFNPDVIVHFASSVGGIIYNNDYLDVVEYNRKIDLSLKPILEANKHVHFIFISSINVYEKNNDFESDNPIADPVTPYAMSKNKSEKYFMNLASKLTVIRPTNIYGAHQYKSHDKVGESHVIPDLIYKIKNTKNREIDVLGDGSQVRNFLHVSDINRFIFDCCSNCYIGNFNLRSEVFLSIDQLAQELINMYRPGLAIKYLTEYMKYEHMMIRDFSLENIYDLGWSSEINDIAKGLNC
jgi:nucleoside-diphosphate-sugar epimerase